MRKADPAKIRTDLAASIEELAAYFERVAGALDGTQHELADVSRLAETVFLSDFVAFEDFSSRLFLAYLNRDPSQYQKHLENAIRQSLEGQDKRGWSWAAKRFTVKRQKHIRLEDLREIVDPRGHNLAFKDAKAMKSRAEDWLSHSHRTRILSIDSHDERLLDAARSIRNYLAHRSKRAKDQMDSMLQDVDQGPPNADLGRGQNTVQNVGAYLKAQVDSQPDRALLCAAM